MENFAEVFSRLKAERGLSNKQIASFTGALLKDIKKWESGLGIPTDKRIIAALEGILGNEITTSVGTLPEETVFNKESSKLEKSIFDIEKRKNTKDRLGFFNRFRSNIAKKERNPQTEMYTYEDIAEVQIEEASERDFSEDTYEDAIEELPYINDPKQLSFYFSRNAKSLFFVLVFFYLASQGIQLFWESLKVIINNLL